MTNKRLYLVGTHHLDLAGRERLTIFFNKLQPKIIALEMSKDRDRLIESDKEEPNLNDIINALEQEIKNMASTCNIDLNETQKETWKNIHLLSLYNTGYELRASEEYVAANNHTQLEYIDLPLKHGTKAFIENRYEVNKDVLKEESREDNKLVQEILDQGLEQYVDNIMLEVHEEYQNAEKRGQEFEIGKTRIQQRQNEQTPQSSMDKLADSLYNPDRDEYMSRKIKELYASLSEGVIIAVVGLGHLYPLKNRLTDINTQVFTLEECNKA